MATHTTSHGAQDLLTLSSALFRDLPVAVTRWGLGQGNERAATEAAWNAYDAGVRVATTTVDALYRTPLFSETVSSTANQLLRWQHMSNAVTRVFVSSVWRVLGLPTAAEIQALTAHVHAVEARVNEAMPHRPPRANPLPRRPQEPVVDGGARSERRKGQPRVTRTAA
jgi:hypothetical protein